MKQTKILGISAKKQGGKNTSLNYIYGQVMADMGLIDRFQINDRGQLIVPTVDPDGKTGWGGFDPFSSHEAVCVYMAENLDPFIKAYSFADPLKRFCIDVMGLREEQCYGTDVDKNTATTYTWGDFDKLGCEIPEGKKPEYFMTAREVLQQFGTNVMCKLYHDIWVGATVNSIKRDSPGLAIICDIRFPNEVEGVQQVGGKVMRLLRAPFGNDDQHSSETALDTYDNWDIVVDNRDVNIPDNNELIKNALIDLFGEELEL